MKDKAQGVVLESGESAPSPQGSKGQAILEHLGSQGFVGIFQIIFPAQTEKQSELTPGLKVRLEKGLDAVRPLGRIPKTSASTPSNAASSASGGGPVKSLGSEPGAGFLKVTVHADAGYGILYPRSAKNQASGLQFGGGFSVRFDDKSNLQVGITAGVSRIDAVAFKNGIYDTSLSLYYADVGPRFFWFTDASFISDLEAAVLYRTGLAGRQKFQVSGVSQDFSLLDWRGIALEVGAQWGITAHWAVGVKLGVDGGGFQRIAADQLAPFSYIGASALAGFRWLF